jgi:hypothetical protein
LSLFQASKLALKRRRPIAAEERQQLLSGAAAAHAQQLMPGTAAPTAAEEGPLLRLNSAAGLCSSFFVICDIELNSCYCRLNNFARPRTRFTISANLIKKKISLCKCSLFEKSF